MTLARLHASPSELACERALARARHLSRTSAARLRRAATRLGGDDGLALACATIDMAASGEFPAGWPIAELIALLDTPAGRRDRQIERLLVELRMIQTDLDAALDILEYEAA